jgi:hypothetical protein
VLRSGYKSSRRLGLPVGASAQLSDCCLVKVKTVHMDPQQQQQQQQQRKEQPQQQEALPAADGTHPSSGSSRHHPAVQLQHRHQLLVLWTWLQQHQMQHLHQCQRSSLLLGLHHHHQQQQQLSTLRTLLSCSCQPSLLVFRKAQTHLQHQVEPRQQKWAQQQQH